MAIKVSGGGGDYFWNSVNINHRNAIKSLSFLIIKLVERDNLFTCWEF
jgi:hypothetical protein